MNDTLGEAALIDNALAAIGMVLARMEGAPPPLPADAPRPATAAMVVPMAPIAVQAPWVVMPSFTAEYRAIHCCLTSASALLGVTQTLIRQPASPTPMERLRQWDDVISQTKTAGRAAYQAALMLTDKQVD
ncbi:hypothetical protein [Variovorax guangxiensis]|uniref:Uncharacterized protein n=1 Tax=Variovorax guangxiensis TaxID=1775474 RepID=A0A502DUJ1_9BURK|nr:hypothetical protein [Variovorax guangxiensis]RZI64772.1 MAG: hypothetical protein EOP79_13810 [Variovorax sp.]TPG24752.1 hypothetical protein EAH83_09875 [Variovorax ginsengisoli]TPG29003.1 hypothetical protein EAH82_09535 [Variovorax guangxiensis]